MFSLMKMITRVSDFPTSHESNLLRQRAFRVWAQLMREGVTVQRILSLAEHKAGMISVTTVIEYVYCVNSLCEIIIISNAS